MKKEEASKNVRDGSELIRCFRELLPADPDLHWHLRPDLASDTRLYEAGPGAELELELDGRRAGFRPVYELKPSVPWVEGLAAAPGNPPPLVVTAELSPRVLEACKQNGISAIDLNGCCWLRAPALLVDRKALPGRSFSHPLEPRNIFVGKSARIVRCLLTARDLVWTHAEIVLRTGASGGLVSRIIQHLISQGYVEKTGAREFRLRDPGALLDEWADADRFSKRNLTTFYAGFLGGGQELARELQHWSATAKVPLAFTQWTAAWARHPFTEPAVCSAYVSALPDAAQLEKLGLRQVHEGGKLWLHVPDDEGVFKETQTHHDLTLVTDAQIYLDLQRTGLRGPEAAAALRDWPGFCQAGS